MLVYNPHNYWVLDFVHHPMDKLRKSSNSEYNFSVSYVSSLEKTCMYSFTKEL